MGQNMSFYILYIVETGIDKDVIFIYTFDEEALSVPGSV